MKFIHLMPTVLWGLCPICWLCIVLGVLLLVLLIRMLSGKKQGYSADD